MTEAVLPMRRFFTIAEIAEQLKVCTKTVRNWIDRGELQIHRMGRHIRVADADLQIFLDRCRK